MKSLHFYNSLLLFFTFYSSLSNCLNSSDMRTSTINSTIKDEYNLTCIKVTGEILLTVPIKNRLNNNLSSLSWEVLVNSEKSNTTNFIISDQVQVLQIAINSTMSWAFLQLHFMIEANSYSLEFITFTYNYGNRIRHTGI